MKKLLIGVASVAALASPMAASAQSWNHGGYGGYHGGYSGYRGGGYGRGYERHDRDGAGLAIGADILGLVAGAALASSHHDYDDRRYSNGYGYDSGYGYGYGSRCYLQSRPVYDDYGDVDYQQVRVCR